MARPTSSRADQSLGETRAGGESRDARFSQQFAIRVVQVHHPILRGGVHSVDADSDGRWAVVAGDGDRLMILSSSAQEAILLPADHQRPASIRLIDADTAIVTVAVGHRQRIYRLSLTAARLDELFRVDGWSFETIANRTVIALLFGDEGGLRVHPGANAAQVAAFDWAGSPVRWFPGPGLDRSVEIEDVDGACWTSGSRLNFMPCCASRLVSVDLPDPEAVPAVYVSPGSLDSPRALASVDDTVALLYSQRVGLWDPRNGSVGHLSASIPPHRFARASSAAGFTFTDTQRSWLLSVSSRTSAHGIG